MLTGEAAGYEPQFITAVIQPLQRELSWRLFWAGIVITGLGVVCEEARDDASAFPQARWSAGQAACGANTSSATGQIVQPCTESAPRSRFVQCLQKYSLHRPLRSTRCTARTAGPQRSQVSFISISLFEGGA